MVEVGTNLWGNSEFQSINSSPQTPHLTHSGHCVNKPVFSTAPVPHRRTTLGGLWVRGVRIIDSAQSEPKRNPRERDHPPRVTSQQKL